MDIKRLFNLIPNGLRTPLIQEYNSILQNYLEHRWTPSELSGGKFCEIVYTILEGHANSSYEKRPSKPKNFVDACRRLEQNSHEPRSFQILIPRLLPALYEIRNNRNVGHVGGDVNPNVMDATAVVQISGWIMGELIRVLHDVSIAQAEQAVNYISERKIPLLWQSSNGIKRVLSPKLAIKDQILLLAGSSSNGVSIEDIYNWLDYQNRIYFNKLLKELHKDRFLELDLINNTIELTPLGGIKIEKILEKIKFVT